MRFADMHCDTIGEIYWEKKKGGRISLRENRLHVDLLGMKKAGYLCQNFAVFVPLDRTDQPFKTCMEMIEVYREQIRENQDLIAFAGSYEEIEKNRRQGKMSGILTVEEGEVLEGNPDRLSLLWESGVRMMTLTWNFKNQLGYPNLCLDDRGMPVFSRRNQKGLTELGIACVQEMERLGILVDVSHLSDGGFWDVVSHTKKPFVASHSNSWEICPVSRNLTDEMLRAIGQRGGVAGLNFCGDFLTFPEGGVSSKSTLKAMGKHIRHMVNTGGIESVGLGTDFDGIESELEIAGAGQMELLTDMLAGEGFTQGQIDLICGENVLRVYKEVLG